MGPSRGAVRVPTAAFTVALAAAWGASGCTSPSGPQVAVFLHDNITAAEREALEADLRAHPSVAAVAHESKEEAARSAEEVFPRDPELDLLPVSYPEAFRVTLRSGEPHAALRAEFENRPGVDEIVLDTPSEEVSLAEGVYGYGA
jgi:cell division protein FtsX